MQLYIKVVRLSPMKTW